MNPSTQCEEGSEANQEKKTEKTETEAEAETETEMETEMEKESKKKSTTSYVQNVQEEVDKECEEEERKKFNVYMIESSKKEMSFKKLNFYYYYCYKIHDYHQSVYEKILFASSSSNFYFKNTIHLNITKQLTHHRLH